jgi:S1-C subfamily serine protease
MDYEERHQKILKPCVRVHAGKAGGSGTVIYSKPNKKGHSTYILTNHHVVEGLIKIDKKWSTLLKRDVKMDVFGIPDCQFFEWRYKSRVVGARSIEADIMTYDADEDLALLKLRYDEPCVEAALFARGAEEDLRLTMPVYAVGAGMGEPPLITGGFLSQFGREIENREFWLQTAPTIFGNSGGAVFLADTYEFIGVPARIAVNMMGFGADAITHLSYCIPITRVYDFLESQLYRFIFDPKFTEEGEATERERRRKEEERSLAAREHVGEETKEEDESGD